MGVVTERQCASVFSECGHDQPNRSVAGHAHELRASRRTSQRHSKRPGKRLIQFQHTVQINTCRSHVLRSLSLVTTLNHHCTAISIILSITIILCISITWLT